MIHEIQQIMARHGQIVTIRMEHGDAETGKNGNMER